LKEITQQVFDYLRTTPLLSVGLAFVAGLAASKTVASEWRFGVISWLFVGSAGLFLSQFVLIVAGFHEYIANAPEFRILFDLVAAYIGSFFVAALIHFLRPL
jgi:uncharacterized membrane protein YeaQ/YmgE (transglycosylase-associated protein family)